MRISNRQMFSTYTSQMNTALANVMESNNQGGTGNRVNRPSDDPASMGRILMYRSSIDNIGRYKKNINEASGWLNLADYTLMQVSDVISQVKALDLQGSTGTVTAENRSQLASSLRGFLQQFLNLANTEYNGQHIFGGHKTDTPSFVEELGVTTRSGSLNEGMFNVTGGTSSATGGSQYSTLIQFTDNGDLKSAVFPGPNFRFSKDGGVTWLSSDPSSPDYNASEAYWVDANTLYAGGVEIKMTPPDPPSATWGIIEAVDITNNKDSANGTWLTVRPTAVYKGDDHDTQVAMTYSNGTILNDPVSADGYFPKDITVRIDDVDGTGKITYSYSLDNGSNWTTGTAPAGARQLAVPGGFLKLGDDPADAFSKGQQFVIHPYRADINLEIAPNQLITVNMVGKDVFGGLYTVPYSSNGAQPVSGPNLFETIGKLIGYAETNDQEGMQECMDELTQILKVITTKNAEIGGRENRIETAFETLITREMSETDGMKSIEAVDTIELMTRLAQQQLTYNTVLKSSSMIMQMSLMNFL